MSIANYNSINIKEKQIVEDNSNEDYENYEQFEIDDIPDIPENHDYDDGENELDIASELEDIKDQEDNEEKQEDEDAEDEDDIDIDIEDEEDEEENINKKSNKIEGGRKKDIPLIVDFKYKEQILISCVNRITRPILTKYEKTLILGQRAQQISKGSNILVNIEKLKNKSPLEIARFELSEGVIPFLIRRPLPNGQYEDWRVYELKDIN